VAVAFTFVILTAICFELATPGTWSVY